MSPEQLVPDGSIDGRADQYSLGVTLYQMLTGTLPFLSAAMPGLLTERLAAKIEPVASLRTGVPTLLDQIVARSLSADPADRYAGMGAMAADLLLIERQLSRAPGLSHGAELPRRRWVGVLVGLAVVLLVATPLWVRFGGRLRVNGARIVVADFVPGVARGEHDRRAQPTAAAELRALVDSTHATTGVSGSYYRESGRLEVFAEVTDALSGQLLLDLGPFVGSPTHPDSVLAVARDRIAAFMRTLAPAAGS